jgi:hypothetical protein
MSRYRRATGGEYAALSLPHFWKLLTIAVSSPTELGEWVTIPTTYAGGAKSEFKASRLYTLVICCVLTLLSFRAGVDDLATVDKLSRGKVDLTYGRYAKLRLHRSRVSYRTYAIACLLRSRTVHSISLADHKSNSTIW